MILLFDGETLKQRYKYLVCKSLKLAVFEHRIDVNIFSLS